MEKEKLKKTYEAICNRYVEMFCKKQDLHFDFWIGGIIGGMASFNNGFWLNINDIVYDINSDQPVGLILEWHDIIFLEKKKMNYITYSLL